MITITLSVPEADHMRLRNIANMQRMTLRDLYNTAMDEWLVRNSEAPIFGDRMEGGQSD